MNLTEQASPMGVDPRSAALARVGLTFVTITVYSTLSNLVHLDELGLVPYEWLNAVAQSLNTSFSDSIVTTLNAINHLLGSLLPPFAILCFMLGLYTRRSQLICIIYGLNIWLHYPEICRIEIQTLAWWWSATLGCPFNTRFSIDALIDSFAERPLEGEDDLCKPTPKRRSIVYSLCTLSVACLLGISLESLGYHWLIVIPILLPLWQIRLLMLCVLSILYSFHTDLYFTLGVVCVGIPLLIPGWIWERLGRFLLRYCGPNIYVFYPGDIGFSHLMARLICRLDYAKRCLFLGHSHAPFCPPTITPDELKDYRMSGLWVYEPDTNQSWFNEQGIARIFRIIPLIGIPISWLLSVNGKILQYPYRVYVKYRTYLPGTAGDMMPITEPQIQGAQRTQLVKVLSLSYLSPRSTNTVDISITQKVMIRLGEVAMISLLVFLYSEKIHPSPPSLHAYPIGTITQRSTLPSITSLFSRDPLLFHPSTIEDISLHLEKAATPWPSYWESGKPWPEVLIHPERWAPWLLALKASKRPFLQFKKGLCDASKARAITLTSATHSVNFTCDD